MEPIFSDSEPKEAIFIYNSDSSIGVNKVESRSFSECSAIIEKLEEESIENET